MSAARRKPAVIVASAFTVAALAALSACGSDNSTTTSPGGSSDSPTAASTGSNGASTVTITMMGGGSGDECQPSVTSAPAGPITFTVDNQSATGIPEFELLSDQKIVGEKENLAPGLAPVSFTLTLGGGTYQMYCPGATTEITNFTVTGQAAPAPTGSTAQLLQQGATEYAGYVTSQVEAMVTGVQALQAKVDAGDLSGAQKAYAAARPFYEKIESDVDGFVLPGFKPTDNKGNLDYLVDMRQSNLDPAVGWSGFHAVERDLFARKAITAQTKEYAADLTANVQKLADLSKTLTYKPEDLANGAAGLLEEVQSSKVSGEEESFSHLDLVVFAANVEGAQQSFAYLKPGLTKIDPTLTATISQRFDSVNAMLDTYRNINALGGYVPYTAALRHSDSKKLSQTVQALQDSLSNLAVKVATA